MFMKHYLFLLSFFLLAITTKAQVLNKGSIYLSGAIGKYKPNTFDEINITPLMYEFKFGYTIIKNISVGLNYHTSNYIENYTEIAALQQPGSLNTDVGIRTVNYIMFGVNIDHHLQFSKNIFLQTTLFFDKLNSTDVMNGEYYSNNQPTGTTHTFTRNYGYKIAVGLNLNLKYFINNNYAISLRFAEYQYRTKSFDSESFLAAPIMIGVNYHFKPKLR